MVAFLEMAGAIALSGLLLYHVVLALRAWTRTRVVYRRIPRRLYRRSLQHALSSRRLMLGLGLWLLAIVAALLLKAGILIPALLCLLLVRDLLWAAIPPVVLVSSASETPTGSGTLREAAAAARPMKTVHFLRNSTAGTEHLRTVDRDYWEEAYGSFADFVPVIVIDCSMVTSHLVNEARYAFNPVRRWKALFVCGVSGECPLLGCLGLDHWPDPTVTVVQHFELRAAIVDRLTAGPGSLHPGG